MKRKMTANELRAARIREAVLKRLHAAAKAGDPCPKSADFAAELGVTSGTIEHAIRTLREHGFLRCKGTGGRRVITFPDGAATAPTEVGGVEDIEAPVVGALEAFEAGLKAAGGFEDAKGRERPGMPRFYPHGRTDHTCGGVACYGGI